MNISTAASVLSKFHSRVLCWRLSCKRDHLYTAAAATARSTHPSNDTVAPGRFLMRTWLAGLLVLLSPSAFAQSTSAPELQFDSVPNFIKLPPDMHLGEAAGVAVNSHGNIFVYSRGGTVANAFGATASQILEFDRDEI